MDTAAHYAYRLLGGLFENRVEPVAEAYDDQPAIMEDGRRDALARAADIRAQLAQLCAAKGDRAENVVNEEDIAASYEAAKSLLADLWAVLLEDARGAPTWAGRTVSRAFSR
jgi:hypothetical protein